MKTVNTHEAKTHFSELLRRVSEGEEIIVANRGVPVARIVPLRESRGRMQGKYQGLIEMSEDFDSPLPEDIQKAFEGEGQESEA